MIREFYKWKATFGLLFLLIAQIVCAQELDIKGQVLDEQGEPLPGVSIIEQGTSNGTITNTDGTYSLTVRSSEATLNFSFLGMVSRSISINGRTVIDVNMELDTESLEEVVVVGYGTTTKKEVTGAVASVDVAEFNKGDINNPMSLVQGKVPGLNIVRSNGGDPNAGFQVRLRGLNSLSGGKSPLIVVDGAIWTNSLDLLNPNEIKSIDVLKDGSAAAIYGTRATNGVILITTKQAKKGEKLNFEFSSFLSIQNASEDNRYLNANEYRDAINTYYPNLSSSLDKGENTEVFDEVTRSPLSQNYSFAVSGGTDNISIRADLYFKENEGLVKNTGSKIITPSISINQTAFNNRLNIGYKLTYSNITRNRGGSNAVIGQSVAWNPTQPIYNPDDEANGGYYTVGAAGGFLNPVAMINERVRDTRSNYLTGDMNGSFEIIDGLRIRSRFSYNSQSDNDGTYLTRYYPNVGTDGDATVSTASNYNILFEPDINYNFSFDQHSFNILAGYSYFENVNEGFSINNYDFDVDDFLYHNIGSGGALYDGLATVNSYKNSNKLVGFYGRVSYNFTEKYLLSGSVRYEGSSRFGANNKWGLFPAISAGWRIHEENFARDLSWLSNLKVRAGYGVTGNQDIPNYLSLPRLAVSDRQFYYNGEFVNAYQPASNPNPDLKWERKAELNIGLDFGFLDNKITGNVEVYKRNITDLLWWYAVPVPPNVFNNIYANVGEMKNNGVEFQVNIAVAKKNDFSWTTSIIYAGNRNEMVSFSDPSQGYELEYLKITPATGTWTQLVEEGKAVGNWFAPIFDGVDENGDATYKDVNGDGTVDVDSEVDREVVGNQYPKTTLGWNNTFKLMNFDLNFFFRGAFGQSALNYERLFKENWQPLLAGGNILKSQLDNPDFTGIQRYDSRYVEDASFIKLDNITLGYNLNTGNASALRVYITGQNLFTITDYSGADPEYAIPDFNTSVATSGANNLSYYPYTRSYLVGLKFKF